MTLKLYELVGAEDRRSSPFCWSCRLALAHKGLEPELIGVRYTDKNAIAFSGQDKDLFGAFQFARVISPFKLTRLR